MPKSEVILWSKLKNRQMHGERFLRQYGVDQYVLDFYCPRLKLAIEIDGDSHFMPGAEEQDKARQEYIESFGIQFLRFTNEDVYKNIDGVCQTLYNRIEGIKIVEGKA
jgi:very-short-patch-repair endonuclease